MREDERDRVSRLGSEAWKRLKKCKDYNDWVKVGEAILVGREWAMNQSQTNKPEGKAYNMAFGEWLQRYKLDDMDKGDRSRLFHMMDALPQIENWRRTITLAERLKLNHPNAILRKFKAAFARTKEPLQLTLEEVRAAYIRSLLSGLEGEADLQVELGNLRIRVMEGLKGKPVDHREA